MKRLLSLAAAGIFLSTLAACGAGSSTADASSNTPAPDSPAALKTTDTVVGTGATAATGQRVQVNYKGWLYKASATDFKGTKFDESAVGKPFTLVIGAVNTNESVIPGFGQGVTGMKVGGKRTILIPAALGYGSKPIYDNNGALVIPANSGLVFEVELVKDCGANAC